MKKHYVIGGVAAALIALGCGSTNTGNEVVGNDDAAPTVRPSNTYPKLSTDDVTLKVKVTEKQCFGDAGCNLSWKIAATVDQSRLRSGVDWDITYEVTGVQDGPYIGSFTLYGDGTYLVDTDFGQTPNKNTKLTAKVTDIDKVGL